LPEGENLMRKNINLNEIAERHVKDRWKDALFIAAAVLLTALALGAVTSKATGKPSEIQGKVEVRYSNFEIGR
jgi:hypothetical protein